MSPLAIPDGSCYGYAAVTLPLRLFRALVATSLALAVWGAARPAWAAALPVAPLCDDRGASAIARPPTLQAPDEAILQARATCDGREETLFAAIVPGRSVHSSAADFAGAALPSWRAPAFDDGGSPVDPPRYQAAPGGGTRSRVERPPR